MKANEVRLDNWFISNGYIRGVDCEDFEWLVTQEHHPSIKYG